MKTERRHELQTNKLADWLGNHLEQLRPHGKKILAFAILGAAVIVTGVMIAKDRQAATAMAWNDFYIAQAGRDREALANVAKSHSGTVVALWAKQSQGDVDLTDGISALYIDRDDAFRSLDDAKQAYTEVVNKGSAYPELMRHSLFGLAQANEATSNLEKAKDFYQKVAQQFPDSPVAVEARERLNAIQNPQVEKFYNWFARQKPKPRSSMPSLPNLPGMPDNLTTLPDSADLNLLPKTPDSSTPGSTASSVPPDTGATSENESKKTDVSAPAPGSAPKKSEPASEVPASTKPDASSPPKESPKPDSPSASSAAPAAPNNPSSGASQPK